MSNNQLLKTENFKRFPDDTIEVTDIKTKKAIRAKFHHVRGTTYTFSANGKNYLFQWFI